MGRADQQVGVGGPALLQARFQLGQQMVLTVNLPHFRLSAVRSQHSAEPLTQRPRPSGPDSSRACGLTGFGRCLPEPWEALRQGEKRPNLIHLERDYIIVVDAKDGLDFGRRAVASTKPNNLWWMRKKKASLAKVRILGHYRKPL